VPGDWKVPLSDALSVPPRSLLAFSVGFARFSTTLATEFTPPSQSMRWAVVGGVPAVSAD
jgi:hypothetical protein